MILLLDNYDSFTFNLAHLIQASGSEVQVRRSDSITVEEALSLNPRAVVISPGPGRPGERGIAVDLVRAVGGSVPVLGVCLGHQAIGMAYGAQITQASEPVHGKASYIHHEGRGPFKGMPSPFKAMRYHSLVVDRMSLPPELEITAWLDDGTVMALRHREDRCHGIQFHPESFLTPKGPGIVTGFLAEAEMCIS